MTAPVRMTPLTAPHDYPMTQLAAIRAHAESCFETHPTVDLIIFDANFPNGTESVTVSREEMLMPPPRDFEAWKREVETR